jgi:hypothetical protein
MTWREYPATISRPAKLSYWATAYRAFAAGVVNIRFRGLA